MKQWLWMVLCAAGVMPVGAVAAAEPTPTKEPATTGAAARFLAHSQVIMFERAEASEPTGGPERLECVRNLSKDAMVPTFEKVMALEMSASDVKKLDEFFSSSAGRKYGQAMLNNTPFDMSLKELRYMDKDVGVDTINRMLAATSPSNERVATILRPAMRALLAPCLK